VNRYDNNESFIRVLVYKSAGEVVLPKLSRTALFLREMPLRHSALSPDANGLK
jgi:hypothetical protein